MSFMHRVTSSYTENFAISSCIEKAVTVVLQYLQKESSNTLQIAMDQLQKIRRKDIKRSTPRNIKVYAKVVKVSDGADTCDLVFIKNGNFQRFKCRLAKTNSPEISEG